MKQTLAVTVMLLAAASARADVGPILPATEYARPTHRIETDEFYPDYLFVVMREDMRQQKWEAEYADMVPERPLMLTTGYYDEPELLIIPRDLASQFTSASSLARAVRDGQFPSVVRQRFHFREMVPSWVGNEVTITYRIQRTASGDGLEIVRTSGNPMRQWYAAGIFFSLAIVIAGLLITRSLFRLVMRYRTKRD